MGMFDTMRGAIGGMRKPNPMSMNRQQLPPQAQGNALGRMGAGMAGMMGMPKPGLGPSQPLTAIGEAASMPPIIGDPAMMQGPPPAWGNMAQGLGGMGGGQRVGPPPMMRPQVPMGLGNRPLGPSQGLMGKVAMMRGRNQMQGPVG